VGGKLYHSKLKKDERINILREFNEGLFNILIGVDALNEGINIPDIDGAICLSGVSTELTNTQQLGRILRYQEGKRRPLFVNFFTDKTVEKNWVEDKTVKAGLKSVTKWITNINELQN
jgi:superfamily II DNA or RNA helicase